MARDRGAKAMTTGAAALVAVALLASAPGAFAQSAENPIDVLAPAELETFTFTFRSTALPDTDVWTLNRAPSLDFNAGENWGFTLRLQSVYDESSQFEDVRAGAFYDITPRMRLGGQLSFSHGEDALARAGAFDEDVPEVKFESAFKF